MKIITGSLLFIMLASLVLIEYITPIKSVMDYQINVHMDTTILYDLEGNELGRVINNYDNPSPLDSLILKLNQ